MASIKLGSDYGEMMTEMARNETWLEGNEPKAILLLLDSFHGMNSNQARDVIHGRGKLVTSGDNDVELVHDDWKPPIESIEKAKEEVLFICNTIMQEKNFHGTWHYAFWQRRINNTWRYTEIADMKIIARHIKELAQYNPVRCLDTARALKMQYNTFIEEYSSEILEQQRSLEPPTPKEMQDIIRDSKGESSVIQKMKSEMMAKIAGSPLIDEESKIKLIRSTEGITNAMQHGVEIKEDKECKSDTGWLNPDGVFYGCEYGQHIPLGQELAAKFYPKENKDHEQRLEDHGWAKVGIKQWHFNYGKFTKKQIKTIKKWAKIHGDPINLNGVLFDVSDLKDFEYKDHDDEIKDLAKDLPRLKKN